MAQVLRLHRFNIRNSFTDGSAFAFATLITALCIPLFKKGIQIPIILLAICWIFTPKRPLRDVWLPILIFTGVFFFHILGMAYTENTSRGMADLEQKLTLLIFPILFGTARSLSKGSIRNTVDAFIVGTLLSVIWSFTSSFMAYQITGEVQSFYMSEFSTFIHPSYIAMYMNFAIAALGLRLLKMPVLNRYVLIGYVLILFLSLSLVFPASKLGFINFFFAIIFLIAYAWRKSKNRSLHIPILLFCLSAFLVFFFIDPVAKSRVANAANVVKQDEIVTTNNLESSQARIIAWKITIDEIAKAPLGVGTGDINDVLMARFRQDEYSELAEIELNPHNNFLQIGLALGIPALLWFLFSLVYPFREIWLKHKWLYAFFLLSFLLNVLVESMLEKQSGVIFFAFFNAMLYFQIFKDDQ